MKRLVASVSAIALALAALLLAPLPAQADEASATISDPTGDVDRGAGVSKKDTSDVTKWGIAYDKHTVTVTWWFKNLRKGTVKHFAVYLEAAEYDVRYVLAKLPGHGAGVYPYPLTAEAEALCGAEVDQKTGQNGRYRVSLDRSCLVPEGETGTVKTIASNRPIVSNDNPGAGWTDEQAAVVVGPAGPGL